MISDANWTGGGVGNYQALAAIHRHLAGVPGQTAVKTITLMLLEWNRAGLLIAIVLLLQLPVLLLRGAFIAGGASSMQHEPRLALVTAFRKAYRDASFSDISLQIVAAIVVELGLWQTTGRRAN
jgi:hypothetical protein